MLAVAKTSPLVAAIVEATTDAIHLDDLAAVLGRPGAPSSARRSPGEAPSSRSSPCWATSAQSGRPGRRLGRNPPVGAGAHPDRPGRRRPSPRFRWGDDGPPAVGWTTRRTCDPRSPRCTAGTAAAPAGGSALAPVGNGLAADDDRHPAAATPRARDASAPCSTRRAEAAAAATDPDDRTPTVCVWFARHAAANCSPAARRRRPRRPRGLGAARADHHRPDADEHARDDTCPSCGQADGIRFLGSAIATLLSVSLSHAVRFGAPWTPREKKALVFTDSVQDAAHRAGFVQARSHTLTLRARAAQRRRATGPVTLDELVDDGAPARRRRPVRPLPAAAPRLRRPGSVHRRSGTPTRQPCAQSARSGNGSGSGWPWTPRWSSGSTPAPAAPWNSPAPPPSRSRPGSPEVAAVARPPALAGITAQTHSTPTARPDDATLVALGARRAGPDARRRAPSTTSGSTRTASEDGNRWSIWGGRPARRGHARLPAGAARRPAYPRVGGTAESGATAASTRSPRRKSWYARWTSRALGVSPHDGGQARPAAARTAGPRRRAHRHHQPSPAATVYAIPPSGVVVAPTTATTWRPAAPARLRHLPDATPGTPDRPSTSSTARRACWSAAAGRLPARRWPDNFYRRLYASPDMRRDRRPRAHQPARRRDPARATRTASRAPRPSPQAPNVLVATPTLEMGIDIGDLSAVFLVLAAPHRRVLPAAGRPGRAAHRQRAQPRLRHRPRRAPAQARRPAVGDQRRGPAAGHLPAGRGDPAPPVHRPPRRRIRPRPHRGAPARAARRARIQRAGQLPRRPHRPRRDPTPTRPGRRFRRHVRRAADRRRRRAPRLGAGRSDGPGTSHFADHLQTASGPLAGHRRDTRSTAPRRSRRCCPTLEAARRVTGRHRRRPAGAALGAAAAQAHPRAAGGPARRVLDRGAGGVRPAAQLHAAGRQRHPRRRPVSWTDPDTRTFQPRTRPVPARIGPGDPRVRAGSPLLRPRLEIAIDAVDLGVDGVAVQRGRSAPRCGYSAADVAAGRHTEAAGPDVPAVRQQPGSATPANARRRSSSPTSPPRSAATRRCISDRQRPA